MMARLLSFAILGLALTSPSLASEKKCDNDNNNLMRCFIASSSLASAYCSSYLSIPLRTVIATATSTSYLTIPTTLVQTNVLTSSTLLTSYTVVVETKTSTSTTTTLGPAAAPARVRRDREDRKPKPSQTSLSCISKLRPAPSSIAFACSCLNVQPATTSTTTTLQVTQTAYTSLTSTTITTTVVELTAVLPTTTTTTVNAIETASSSCFGIYISGISGGAADTSLVGQSLMLTSSSYNTLVGQLTHFTDPAMSGTFYLSSTNSLVSANNGAFPGRVAGISAGVNAFYIQFALPAEKATYQFVDLICSIAPGGALTCKDGYSTTGPNTIYYCSSLENHAIIANYEIPGAGCTPITLGTIPRSCAGVM